MRGSDIDEVAVIGLGCRFPDANTPEDFWQNILAGRCSIRQFDRSSLIDAGVPQDIVDHPDYIPALANLVGVDEFDPEFFGMTVESASIMDPQHRVFLQVVVHALEDAGIAWDRTTYTIGCFAGAGMSLYGGREMFGYHSHNLLSNRDMIRNLVSPQITVANKNDYLATKTAYQFNFTGPCQTVNTACSTGLTAIHMARRAILNDECDIAIAGASAIPPFPLSGYLYEGGLLSPTATCKPFDASANGTVGGAGCGVVVLKRLTDAIRDGDAIRAVIKSSAVNNDGNRKIGYLSPGIYGQSELFKKCYEEQDLDTSTVGYLETHGTATPLGDPVEIQALKDGFVSSNIGNEDWRCAIGAVKSNIGHLDTAAGVAGFIKAVMVVEKSVIPALTGFETLNPEIDFEQTPFWIPTQNQNWSKANYRRAAVSSFGAGGANAHAVIESFPLDKNLRDSERDTSSIFCLSAKTKEGLNALVDESVRAISKDQVPVQALCQASISRRSQYSHRLAIVSDNINNLSKDLQSYNGQLQTSQNVFSDVAKHKSKQKVVFAFAGQGDLNIEVVQSYRKSFPEFSKQFGKYAKQIQLITGNNILSQIDSGKVSRSASVVQPIHFALNVCIFELWKRVGVFPDFVLGHSLGEYSAAVAAGILKVEDALFLVCKRGILMDSLCETGGMLAAKASPDQLLQIITSEGFGGKVGVATHNSEKSTVLSGDIDACEKLSEVLKESAIQNIKLDVTHAFHSHYMQNMIAEFSRELKRVEFSEKKIPIFPTISSRSHITQQEYWLDQLVSTVEFHEAFQTAELPADPMIVEIGSAATLSHHMQLTRPSISNIFASSASGLHKGAEAFKKNVAKLYCERRDLNIEWIGKASSDRHVSWAHRSLPVYPFSKKTCWVYPSYDKVSRQTTGSDSYNSEVEYSPALMRRISLPQICPTLSPEANPPIIEVCFETQHQLQNHQYATGEKSWSAKILLSDFTSFRSDLDDALKNLVGSDRKIHIVLNIGDGQSLSSGNILLLLKVLAHLGDKTCISNVTALLNGSVYLSCAASLSTNASIIRSALKTFALEYRNIDVGFVDIDDCAEAPYQAALSSVRNFPSQNVYSQGKAMEELHWIQTYKPDDFSDTSNDNTEKGAYCITGGLSGFGLAVAEFLASSRVARHLILVGRGRTTDPDLERRLSKISSKGIKVSRVIADLVNPSTLEKIENCIDHETMPLQGIVHAAGVVDDKIIGNQDQESWSKTMAPKQEGLLLLERLAQQVERYRLLDCFIVFSSLAAPFGSPSQVNYAAANASMIPIIAGRNKVGSRGTIIHWGPIQKTGMSERVLPTGSIKPNVKPLQIDEAMNIFHHILLNRISGEFFAASLDKSLFHGCISEKNMAHNIWPPLSKSIDLSSEANTKESFSTKKIEDTVEAMIRALLPVSGLEINFNQPMIEFGLDSFLGLQLRNNLNDYFSISLKPQFIFECVDLNTLCGKIHALIGGAESSKTEEYAEKLRQEIQRKL